MATFCEIVLSTLSVIPDNIRRISRSIDAERLVGYRIDAPQISMQEVHMITGIGGGQNGIDAAALWQDLLKKADKNGDNKISKEEFEAAMPQRGDGPGPDDLFSKIDTDGDGYITESENATAVNNMRKGRPPHEPDPLVMFKKADTDGDGKIRKSEFKATLPQDTDDATANKIFDAMDTNQDGVVDFAEYMAAMQKMGLTSEASDAPNFSVLA
jgi:Ca2+-binding EF-hand superfamily protein